MPMSPHDNSSEIIFRLLKALFLFHVCSYCYSTNLVVNDRILLQTVGTKNGVSEKIPLIGIRGSMKKVKIYCDSGADISKIRSIEHCELYQFPYDSPYRPKKPLLLAKPSAAQWRDCHAAWMEFSEITWADFCGSNLHSQMEAIISSENRRDVLHFDSAYKTACKLFLTSDKGDIWSKRDALESLTGIKIFHTPFEIERVVEHLSMLVASI